MFLCFREETPILNDQSSAPKHMQIRATLIELLKLCVCACRTKVSIEELVHFKEEDKRGGGGRRR